MRTPEARCTSKPTRCKIIFRKLTTFPVAHVLCIDIIWRRFRLRRYGCALPYFRLHRIFIFFCVILRYPFLPIHWDCVALIVLLSFTRIGIFQCIYELFKKILLRWQEFLICELKAFRRQRLRLAIHFRARSNWVCFHSFPPPCFHGIFAFGGASNRDYSALEIDCTFWWDFSENLHMISFEVVPLVGNSRLFGICRLYVFVTEIILFTYAHQNK